MNLYDNLTEMGQNKWLRPLASFILGGVVRLPFSVLLNIAGRRLVTAFAAAPAILLTGSNMKEALKDAGLLYKAMRFTVDYMHMDTLCLMADLSLEAEACGCPVMYEDTSVPSVKSHLVKNIEDIEKLRVPDPYSDGRMPVFLKTMRMMKRNYAEIKMACVTGPFTLALHIGGPDLYIETVNNPKKAMRILDFCTNVGIKYARALVKEGADMILIAEPAGSQLSPGAFELFSLPYTKKMTKAIKRSCVLHICGRAGHLIRLMCKSGASAISVDDVDMTTVIDEVPGGLVVAGNLSPLKLLNASPSEIGNDVTMLVETVKRKKKFIVAPGCDLSPKTPIENIFSFVGAVKKLS